MDERDRDEPDEYSDRGEAVPREETRDERIKAAVCERLGGDPELDARDVDVTVVNGVVTLQGTVPTRRERRRAEDVVRGCPEVTGVRNELGLRSGELPPPEERRPDDERRGGRGRAA